MIYFCGFITATAFQRVVVAYERLKGHTPPRPAAATATAQTSGDVSPFGRNRLFWGTNWLVGFQFQVSFSVRLWFFWQSCFNIFYFFASAQPEVILVARGERGQGISWFLSFFSDVLDATGNGIKWDIVNYPPIDSHSPISHHICPFDQLVWLERLVIPHLCI